jgi:hypothetical protein
MIEKENSVKIFYSDLEIQFYTYDNDNDNEKAIKSLLKGKGLLPPEGLARLDS